MEGGVALLVSLVCGVGGSGDDLRGFHSLVLQGRQTPGKHRLTCGERAKLKDDQFQDCRNGYYQFGLAS